MIRLSPETYVCPDHDEDVTALVALALGGEHTVVTTFGASPGKNPKSGPAQPFVVVVPCSKGEEGPHDVECAGTYADV